MGRRGGRGKSGRGKNVGGLGDEVSFGTIVVMTMRGDGDRLCGTQGPQDRLYAIDLRRLMLDQDS